MSHGNTDSLGTYNSLTDKHLTGYFNNAKLQKHLQKVGLITQDGRIVPEKEHKHNLIQTARQEKARESMAPGIFQKAAELELLHQNEMKRKVEEFSHRERIHKTKTERFKSQEPMGLFSSLPPTDQKTSPTHHSGRSTQSMGYSRPKTVAGKMQKPVRLKPLNPGLPSTKMKKGAPRANSTSKEPKLKAPKTPSVLSPLKKTLPQNKSVINMVFFGKTVHWSNDLKGLKNEVKVFQQLPGGENLCVFKGMLKNGETFQFVSRCHKGFPFSLTFFINGLHVERFNSCCEFKYRKSGHHGNQLGYFGFSSVEGASPCNKCKIALSKDKQSTPLKQEQQSASSCTTESIDEIAKDVDQHSTPESNVSEEMNSKLNEQTEVITSEEDYEEDIDADDEGPVENSDDEVEPTPSSPTSNVDKHVKEMEENKDLRATDNPDEMTTQHYKSDDPDTTESSTVPHDEVMVCE